MRRLGRPLAFAVTAILANALLISCGAAQKKDYEHCTAKTSTPAAFWAKYNIPTVDGAQLCSDNGGGDNADLTTIYYNEAGKTENELFNIYASGFKQNGWEIAKLNPVTKYNQLSGTLKKGDDYMYLGVSDCYAGQSFPLSRPCLLTEIRPTTTPK